MKFKAEVTEVTKEDLVSILSGFYSYSGYWVELLDWHADRYIEVKESLEDPAFEEVLAELLERGDWLKITDEDDVRVLYKEDIKKGIQLALDNNSISLDPDDWDAADHDMIIQYALFGEVLYG
jgi:hypothetical protein